MKAIIIEDEAIIADKLRQSLSEIAPHIDVQAVLPSIRASRRWFTQYAEPDLLFMDIQLSDGVSFELFQYSTFAARSSSPLPTMNMLFRRLR